MTTEDLRKEYEKSGLIAINSRGSMTAEDLRKEYEKSGLIAINSRGEYTRRYSMWLEKRLIESEQREREAYRSGYSRALATFGEKIDSCDEEVIENELNSRLSGGKETK